jgi:hypothetical protein
LVNVKGICFEGVKKINIDNPHVEKIVLLENKRNENDSQLEITVNIKKITEANQAIILTREILNDVINLISYKTSAVFDSPIVDTVKIDNNFQKFFDTKIVITDSLLVDDEFFSELELRLTDIQLKQSLRNNFHFKLYKGALNNADPIVSYMFLYSILTDLKGNQSNIDTYIQSLEPDVILLKSENPRFPNKEETIYTWLRNQVGHTNKDSDLLRIRTEIDSKLSGLTYFVKKAIIEKI